MGNVISIMNILIMTLTLKLAPNINPWEIPIAKDVITSL